MLRSHKGIRNKPTTVGKWIYVYPVRVYSKEEDDPNYRFGVISYCINMGPPGMDKWYAFTVRQIFLRNWNPGNIESCFDGENVQNKKAYLFSWVNKNNAADVSQNKDIIVPKGYFGQVKKEFRESNMVMLEIDKTVVESQDFINEGFWAQMA